MRADPVSLLAAFGADNLLHEPKRFADFACFDSPVGELCPDLLGCKMPPELFYHRGHIWARPAKGNTIVIGIDDLASHLLGPIDEVKMPGPGRLLKRGKPAVHLSRNAKSVDVISPVDGKVVLVNQSVIDMPRIIETRPYTDGWLMVIHHQTSTKDLSGMMFGRTARDWQKQKVHRLNDMFQGKMATAADGATLARDALAGIPGVRWPRIMRKLLKG
jgi:glycine cleavage system H lipoate-binding protein